MVAMAGATKAKTTAIIAVLRSMIFPPYLTSQSLSKTEAKERPHSIAETQHGRFLGACERTYDKIRTNAFVGRQT